MLPTPDDVNAWTADEFYRAYPDAPEHLDPENPQQADWVARWSAMRDEIVERLANDVFYTAYPIGRWLDPSDADDATYVDYWTDIRDQLAGGGPGRYDWSAAAAPARQESTSSDGTPDGSHVDGLAGGLAAAIHGDTVAAGDGEPSGDIADIFSDDYATFAGVLSGIVRVVGVGVKASTPIRFFLTAGGLIDNFLEQREAERRSREQLEELRLIRDGGRRWTLANVAARVLEDFATSSDADTIVFTGDEGAQVQTIADEIITLFHRNDYRGVDDIEIEDGWLSSMPAEVWARIESQAESLLDSFEQALRGGNPERTQGPDVDAGGTVHVDVYAVHDVFLSLVNRDVYVVEARQ